MKHVLLIVFLAASCGTGKKPIEFSKLAHGMADVACRAISIREKRFDLANEIRFAQDTLLVTKNIDSIRLKSKLALLNTEKEYIVIKSQLIADSIKYFMDSLSKNYLIDPVGKKRFNDSLNSILIRRGCLNNL